ncbi:MAG TPA: polysaccharide biosynthesis C-terminal domain-containing protein [Flavobacteriales bacterium]|nr:oligosaccharide flippase family protein [Flavobacteriales bacterium]HRN35968.1 polysaccharide biosynthesis C-terminal domain-containing protein [Flavobacteriales bacterium]HRO39100.1 polysaccharide biosynthesis C-terminal domain-containing protein [Flavobacteriales bacterium]HRP81520.1 polysaccharide biosynthesis C-terminal domain-containing protein [Flavobacteriales bacterium]HRQ83695.1 polysaccharide biosynthesis C-terminal domain-containing protein [Flavobacteriales bacterium]
MSVLRKLAGQTAIYGLSSIVARFLNYLLTPLYTSRGVFAPAAYGVITSLYAWTAFLNVVLTYGMETTFFRFANKQEDGGRTYATAVYLLSATTAVFLLLGLLFGDGIAAFIGYPEHATSVRLLVVVIAMDALTVVPMARLRQENRPWKFAAINVVSVLVNIGLNLFFLAYCMPRYNAGEANALINAVYDPAFGVGYVFLANVASSGLKLLLLLPEWPALRAKDGRGGFDAKRLGPMLAFGLPLLVAGLAGMTNETADRVLMKHLLPAEVADGQIGIYGACYKLAILITLFIQAFRFAAEPFFFSHAREKNSAETFARIMNIFVAVCMGAFLLVMLFLDLFKWFIPNPAYWPGLVVVPVLLLANVFLGIYYNQSVWYKLSDRTHAGGTIAIIGAVITLVLLFWWIPVWGYLGAAWATLICYASMAAISYVWGQKHYPIPYNVQRVLGYMAAGVFLWWGCEQLPLEGAMKYALRALVLLGFVVVAWRMERGAPRGKLAG